ncbi:MAG: DUF2085 domain-containing protein [Acidobacteriota bacterium]
MRAKRVACHGLLLILTSVWLALIFLPAYSAAQQWAITPWLYFFFRHVCHQIPERSFFWMGHQLAVCHRCLGIYLGFWLGLIALPIVPSLTRPLRENPRWLILFVLPMLGDVFAANTVASRFLTGMIAGFPVAFFIMTAFQQLPFPGDVPGDSHEPGPAR